MRATWALSIFVTLGSLSSTGCYVDGKWQSPSMGSLAWWRKSPDPAPSVVATAPVVTLPSASSTPGRDASAPPIARAATPGAPSAVTAAVPSNSPSYDGARANYTSVSPSAYPNTGMASFNSTQPPRANTADYNATAQPAANVPSSNPYAVGGRYDTRGGQDLVQQGPYSAPANPAANAAGNGGTVARNPMYDGPARGTPAVDERYNDPRTAARTNDASVANNYGTPPVTSNNAEPRVATRDTTGGPIIPGNTGYAPGNTGYQPTPANGHELPVIRGGAIPTQPGYQNNQPTSQPANGNWTPGGTSRYNAPVNNAGANAVNPSASYPATSNPAAAAPTNAYPANGATRPAYNDPSRDMGNVDGPVRTNDPSRYDY